MRLSPGRYPELIDFYCPLCDADHDQVKVDSIEGEDVVATCPGCGDSIYTRVIE